MRVLKWLLVDRFQSNLVILSEAKDLASKPAVANNARSFASLRMTSYCEVITESVY